MPVPHRQEPREAVLSPLEGGVVAVGPCREPFGVVVSLVQRVGEFLFTGESFRKRMIEGSVEGCPGLLDTERCVLGQRVGQRSGAVVHLRCRTGLGHQPHLECLCRVDELAGQHNLLCSRESDQSGESLCGPTVWERPQFDLDDPVVGLVREDPEVRGQGQLKRAGGCTPFDTDHCWHLRRRDGVGGRLQQPPGVLEVTPVSCGRTALAHQFQVHPRTEHGSLPEECDRPDPVLVVDGFDSRREVGEEVLVHGVTLLRPVQHNIGTMPVCSHEHRTRANRSHVPVRHATCLNPPPGRICRDCRPFKHVCHAVDDDVPRRGLVGLDGPSIAVDGDTDYSVETLEFDPRDTYLETWACATRLCVTRSSVVRRVRVGVECDGHAVQPLSEVFRGHRAAVPADPIGDVGEDTRTVATKRVRGTLSGHHGARLLERPNGTRPHGVSSVNFCLDR